MLNGIELRRLHVPRFTAQTAHPIRAAQGLSRNVAAMHSRNNASNFIGTCLSIMHANSSPCLVHSCVPHVSARPPCNFSHLAASILRHATSLRFQMMCDAATSGHVPRSEGVWRGQSCWHRMLLPRKGLAPWGLSTKCAVNVKLYTLVTCQVCTYTFDRMLHVGDSVMQCRLAKVHDAVDILLHIGGGFLFMLVWVWHLSQPASRLPGAQGFGWCASVLANSRRK
jgi:hypothetical protein